MINELYYIDTVNYCAAIEDNNKLRCSDMKCLSKRISECKCVCGGGVMWVLYVYELGSHQETEFALDGSNIETLKNGLCTEM